MSEKKSTAKKKKRLKITRGMVIAFRVLLVLTLIVIFTLYAADRLNIASITDINDSIRSVLSGINPGPGYPFPINSGNVRDITVLNGELYILEASDTLSLDTTAKEIKRSGHTYSNPAFATRGSKAIVFNRNGNRFRVENRTDTLFEGKTEKDERIITAAIGSKGNIALATFSDSCSSRLTVLSSTYKKTVFSWDCSNDRITSVDLSDNGLYAAVSVVGAMDGDIISRVIIFDFRSNEPVAEFSYQKTAMLAVRFVRNDNVVAVGDNLTVCLKNFKQEEKKEYGSSILSDFAFSDDGYTVLMLSEHGSTNNEVVYCYTGGFSKAFEKKFDKNIKSLNITGGHISVLFEDEAVILKMTGGVYKKYSVNSSAIEAFCMGAKTYLYCSGEITRLK